MLKIKDIKGFEDYTIDTNGNVYSKKSHRYLKQTVTKHGFSSVSLYNGKYKKYSIHKLVAEAFIPNYNKLPQVIHIDGNKQNNCADNLQWCTNKQKFKGGNTKKKVAQYDKQNNLVRIYESISEASKQTGIVEPSISQCVNGRRKKAGGFIWHFL